MAVPITFRKTNNTSRIAPVMVSVFGKVRACSTHFVLPSNRHNGIRKRFWCSSEFANAVELCRLTTSTRCSMTGGTRLSSICSTIRAPIGGSGGGRLRGSSSSVSFGRFNGRTATVLNGPHRRTPARPLPPGGPCRGCRRRTRPDRRWPPRPWPAFPTVARCWNACRRGPGR